MLRKITQNIPGQPGIKWIKAEVHLPTALELADELENDPITCRLGFVLQAASELRQLHYANQEMLKTLRSIK